MYLMIYKKIGGVFGPVLAQFRSKLCGEIHWWWTHSLEHEVKRPLYFTNITGHIEPILEQNEYCEDNVLNLKRHSWNMLFVRCLDLLRFSCNQ